MTHDYTIGGALHPTAPTYVTRQADRTLQTALLNHQYCTLFNARQMGKSSLRVHTTQQLKTQNILSAIIDTSALTQQGMTADQWYLSLTNRLRRSLRLKFPPDHPKLQPWWNNQNGLPPNQRFTTFIQDILLPQTQQPIVLFLDEIDSLLPHPFSDDFFALLRNLYQTRADNPDYNRLTIVLIGVANPSNLIADPNRTPYNIGTAIPLHGFTLQEATPLAAGLSHLSDNPMALLNLILRWTNGQPFLTQKLCQLVADKTILPQGRNAKARIDAIVQQHIIDDWLQQDSPEHLKTIQDRILASPHAARILEIYNQILQSRHIPLDGSPAQSDLLLSGLVIAEDQTLQIANPIYKAVFNPWWLAHQADSLCAPTAQPSSNGSLPSMMQMLKQPTPPCSKTVRWKRPWTG